MILEGIERMRKEMSFFVLVRGKEKEEEYSSFISP